MNPATIIPIITLLKQCALLLMELQNKNVISKDELKAKTPEEILADMGINPPPVLSPLAKVGIKNGKPPENKEGRGHRPKNGPEGESSEGGAKR